VQSQSHTEDIMKFESQVLVINTTDRAGAVIQSPEFTELESRKFICGTSVMLDDKGPKWTSGLRIWIAVDSIVTITEVPTVDEYVRRCALHNERTEATNEARFTQMKKTLLPKI
jgi:hypothetical protein